MIGLLLAVLLPGLYWDQAPQKVEAIKKAGITRIYAPAGQLAAWKAEGIDAIDTGCVLCQNVPVTGVDGIEAMLTGWVDCQNVPLTG